MPASEAQVRANQANSARSTGPKTLEGKEISRANSYKHGLTGSGIVVPDREADEVQRRIVAFREELRPSGEVGESLARHAAIMSVRMERCNEHENAMLTERVRQAEADFVAPEGLDDAVVARLRTEAGKLALFDPSKEANLARKYEASATRGFFRALKELRVLEKQAKAAEAERIEEKLASILPGDLSDQAGDPRAAEVERSTPPLPDFVAEPIDLSAYHGADYVNISIGKPR